MHRYIHIVLLSNMVSVYVVNTANEFHLALKRLKTDSRQGNVNIVGLDSEHICKDNYPESFDKSLNWVLDNTSIKVVTCILQISSKNVCMVINLVNLGPVLPKKLMKLLKNESWIKMGVGIDNDMQILSQNYNLGYCSGCNRYKRFSYDGRAS